MQAKGSYLNRRITLAHTPLVTPPRITLVVPDGAVSLGLNLLFKERKGFKIHS